MNIKNKSNKTKKKDLILKDVLGLKKNNNKKNTYKTKKIHKNLNNKKLKDEKLKDEKLKNKKLKGKKLKGKKLKGKKLKGKKLKGKKLKGKKLKGKNGKKLRKNNNVLKGGKDEDICSRDINDLLTTTKKIYTYNNSGADGKDFTAQASELSNSSSKGWGSNPGPPPDPSKCVIC
jgi:uncharacterized protein YjbI with pentapeptide repeats